MYITDLGWVTHKEHPMAQTHPDCQRKVYVLPKPGWSISLIRGDIFHSYKYAWEGAMIGPGGVDYSTPLTNDVEVFATDEDAIAWIVKAYQWALCP